jgi:hypothetical protein
MKHDDSYLSKDSLRLRDLPDDSYRKPCRVYTDARGKKHPQHTAILIYLDDTYIEYRCMGCLEYFTYRRVKQGQQSLF